MTTKVLVIDDEPDMRFVARLVLQAESYEVVEAHTGEEALDLLAFEKPDVMLLDLKLPGIDGWEVMKRLAEVGVRPAIVLMSAGIDTRQPEGAERADGVLRKPFSSQELVSAIAVAQTP